MKPLRWIHAGLSCALVATGVFASSAHAEAPLSTEASIASVVGASVEGSAAEGASAGLGIPTDGRVQRVELHYAPSFSPWVRVTHVWVQRGSWWLASVEGQWAQPWPAYTNSSLQSVDVWRAMDASLRASSSAWTPTACPEAVSLAAGDLWIKVDWIDAAGEWVRRCASAIEAGDARAPSDGIRALMALGAPLEGFDQWTHPFWLRRESGLLRFDIEGFARIVINDALVGPAQGTVSVRLPTGEHRILVEDAAGAITEERVRVYPDETTILRLRVNAEDRRRAEEP